jgi:primosomal protein N' (replication factor Y)
MPEPLPETATPQAQPAGLIRVALDVPLDRTFDYRAPPGVAVGQCVCVPFGRRTLVGVVVACLSGSAVPEAQLRPISAVIDEIAPLGVEWMRLAEFTSRYYQRPLGEVMLSALPPRLRRPPPARPRRRPAAPARPGPPVASAAAIAERQAPALTADQAAAVDQVSASFGRHEAFLLFGITGSGKTEVYLQLVALALARGAQVLVLVPEIHLTPQLERQFAERFAHARTAMLHSERAALERAHAWRAAQSGEIDIAIGTRLAVFTPLPRLGLIIVDEEHDPSFKQQDGPRYSARDLAVYRAHAGGVPVVLGSATPSLESWANARSGRYRLLQMPQRARPGARLPSMRLVDTRRDSAEHGLTSALGAALAERLDRGEQSLLFLNRRGYAPVLACSACGWVAGCKRCSTPIALHLSEARLRCHHCGLESAIPRRCPECGNVDLHPFGRGTERLETSLRERFPAARIARIDSDSMRHKGTWEKMHAAIRARAVDVIVGTQMLAKGHDFPHLTLVGVINPDAALFAADYRAPERLFAQLQQVAGRAGRDALPGEVIIQTRYPEHPIYQALVSGDYAAFASQQLGERAAAGFPPAVAEAVLRTEAPDGEAALGFLLRATECAPAAREGISLYDPVPMSLARVAGRSRAQLLVQAASRSRLQGFLTAWRATLELERVPARLRWAFDVDPIEF